jgi:hypothetical protein
MAKVENLLADWIPEVEMAKATKKSLRKLRKDRQLGIGMPWSKFGKTIYYQKSAPATLLKANEVRPVRRRSAA